MKLGPTNEIRQFIDERLTDNEGFKDVFDEMTEDEWRPHYEAVVKKFGRNGAHFLERLRDPHSKQKNTVAADIAREWKDGQVAQKANWTLGVAVLALFLSAISLILGSN